MAAENSDAMTLEQFKVYSGKNAVGGGGWELLWEGNAKSYQSSPATIPVDVRTYEAIYIYGNNVNDPDHRFFLSVKPVSDTMWYAGEDNVFMKIRVAQTMLIEAQYYGITVLQVYGMKSSGGGGAVTPDVLWEGNSSQTGTFDPRPYSRLEITGRDAMTTTTTESISAPFEAGKTSEGTGRFTFYYDPFSGGTAAYISGIEINVLKVTGYR